MKTRQQVITEIEDELTNRKQLPYPNGEKNWSIPFDYKDKPLVENEDTRLASDLEIIRIYAQLFEYNYNAADTLAIGYMCGQSGLTSIFNNEVELRKAVDKYDETDPTMRMDTVGETLHDLFNYKF